MSTVGKYARAPEYQSDSKDGNEVNCERQEKNYSNLADHEERNVDGNDCWSSEKSPENLESNDDDDETARTRRTAPITVPRQEKVEINHFMTKTRNTSERWSSCRTRWIR